MGSSERGVTYPKKVLLVIFLISIIPLGILSIFSSRSDRTKLVEQADNMFSAIEQQYPEDRNQIIPKISKRS